MDQRGIVFVPAWRGSATDHRCGVLEIAASDR